MILTIELVPQSSFLNNVRAILTSAQWDQVRKQVYSEAWYVCEICGDVGPKHPVECHEIWNYDDLNHIQKLEKMVALCPNCHSVKHIGLAEVKGNFNEALSHFMKVNKVSKKKSLIYIENQFKIWEQRSEHSWKLDVSILKNYGININKLKSGNNAVS